MGGRQVADIVILGASYAGISIAHQLCRSIQDEFETTPSLQHLRVVLVSPSRRLFCSRAAAEALCPDRHEDLDQLFIPFLEAFHDYDYGLFRFIQGEAVDVNFVRRTVEVKLHDLDNQHRPHPSSNLIVPYHALVIATGCSADSDLLSLHGAHEQTIKALEQFRLELPHASHCVIVGGGAVAIACAGQLASWAQRVRPEPSITCLDWLRELPGRFGGKPQRVWRKSEPETITSSDGLMPPQRLAVTVISGGTRLLSQFPTAVGRQAEKLLKQLHVRVVHGVRLIAAQQLPSRATRCILSDDLHLTCDLLVAATGSRPNTAFIGAAYKCARGFVLVQPQTLRVHRADRVFALGSCAALGHKEIRDVLESVPVLVHNLKNDLLDYQMRMQQRASGLWSDMEIPEDKFLDHKARVVSLVQVSSSSGTGQFKGYRLPTPAYWLFSRRQHDVEEATKLAESGELLQAWQRALDCSS